MAKRRYTRVEEEIIQILEQKEREPGWRRARFRLRRPRLPRFSLPRFNGHPRLGGFSWLLLTFGLALAAVLLAGTSHLLAALLAIASMLVFLSPIVTSRRAGGLPYTPARRWRGKDIDLPPSRTGLLGEIRYRIWEYRHR
ncbi:MAG TPA: hypothetical protein VFI42_20790 [Thermomicrobiaceae bacterium]|nr:hypothetical protein [Thermomicrobiaceae bacterium]